MRPLSFCKRDLHLLKYVAYTAQCKWKELKQRLNLTSRNLSRSLAVTVIAGVIQQPVVTPVHSSVQQSQSLQLAPSSPTATVLLMLAITAALSVSALELTAVLQPLLVPATKQQGFQERTFFF